MISKDTKVDVWEADRWYSSGPNEICKPDKLYIKTDESNGLDGWICCGTDWDMVAIQSNMPYKDVFFWHERGHCLFHEINVLQQDNSLHKEVFCDRYTFLICGWERSMEAMLWALSAWNGQNDLLSRLLIQVGAHEEEFKKMLDELIEKVEGRVGKQKKIKTADDDSSRAQGEKEGDEASDEKNVDVRWLKHLNKLKKAFNSRKKDRRKVDAQPQEDLENDIMTRSEPMISTNTIVDVYDPGRCYKAGPSYSRKTSSKEIEENGGAHVGNWICFEKYGVIIMQQDIPYRQMLFWRARGNGIWNELHGTDSEPSLKRERFCDDFMFFFCGWKRSMETMLWLLSVWSGPMILYSMNKRVLAQVGEHEEEFQKMLDGLMERVEKRVSKSKKSRKANDVLTSKNDDKGMDAGRNVDIHWLENLKKLKQDFHSGN